MRDAFLEIYLKDINFDERFFIARKIEVGGVALAVNPNLLMIGGFNKWWIGPTRDSGSENGYSNAFYIPENPTMESFVDFVEKRGMSLWEVLDERFGLDQSNLWSFVFPKDSVLNFSMLGFLADSQRVRAESDIEYITDITLVCKLTAYMAVLWDIARLIRYFEQNELAELAEAFRKLYESKINDVISSLSGEDFLAALATIPPFDEELSSLIGEIAGYKEENLREDIDPNKKRLTQTLNVVDLYSIFSDPQNIQFLLGKQPGTEIASLTQFISSFRRLQFKYEEDFEITILEILNIPIQSINL